MTAHAIDTQDGHGLAPIRIQLYTVQIQCVCGWVSAVVPSSERHLAWGQGVRHIIDVFGPEF